MGICTLFSYIETEDISQLNAAGELSELAVIAEGEDKTSWFIWLLVLCTSISGLLFGGHDVPGPIDYKLAAYDLLLFQVTILALSQALSSALVLTSDPMSSLLARRLVFPHSGGSDRAAEAERSL